MAQEPLSPCPECGGEARLDKNVQLRFRGAPAKGSGKRFSRVRCLEPDCGFATKKFKPEKGENNKKLYAKATTCWERFCKEKKEGCLSDGYKESLRQMKRKHEEKKKKAAKS